MPVSNAKKNLSATGLGLLFAGLFRFLCASILCLCLSGCAALLGRITGGLADSLSAAILDNQDIATVEQGVPAYLLMLDALVRTSPENTRLMLSAARLYGAYSGGFIDDPERSQRLSSVALDYAFRALCKRDSSACDLRTVPLDDFQAWLANNSKPAQVELLYAVAVAWAGWIQAHAADWNAIAQLARVKLMMDAVLKLDEAIDYGGPHLYYGVFETLLPAALGGRPEIGRQHFEKAIAISEGNYLMTKVFYARQYARLVYDRELHDRLLEEVIAADPRVEGITLINKLAQEEARAMLKSGEDYF